MALQSYTLAVGNLIDDESGKNYIAGKAVYIEQLNNTLAQIYSDADGLLPIIQDGLANITDSSGVFTFWVDEGDYYIVVDSERRRVSVTGADYFNSRIDQTINDITSAMVGRGAYYPVGSFEAGFTYTDINQVGTFGGTEYYVYTGGLTNLPHTVTAGTNPTSSGDYEQVVYNSAGSITKTGGGTVQDFIDNLSASDVQAFSSNLSLLLSSLSVNELIVNPNASTTSLLRNRTANSATRHHQEPNGYVDSGTIVKYDFMFDPFADDLVNYRIGNIFTKQGVGVEGMNGQNGVYAITAKGVGDQFGVFPSINIGFSDDNANGVPLKVMYFDTSDTAWRPDIAGAWRSGRTIGAGHFLLSANKLYQAQQSGTTGSTKPVHTSGTVSDGSIDFLFVRDYAAASNQIKPCIVVGDRDDMPLFGFSTVRAQFAKDSLYFNGVKQRYVSNTGVELFNSGADLNTDNYYFRIVGGGSFRVDASSKFMQYNGISEASVASSFTGGETSPSITGARVVVFGNTSATNVTSFSNGIGYQRFTVHSSNGQTTLIHGTNIKLSGGLDKTLGQDDVLMFEMNGNGSVAKQILG